MSAAAYSKEVLDEAVAALGKANGNRAQAANSLGVPHSTFKHRIFAAKSQGYKIPAPQTVVHHQKTVDQHLVEHKFKGSISQLQGERKELLKRVEEAEARAEAAIEIGNIQPKLIIKVKPSKIKRPATPVAFASDWHVEERVDAGKVSGLNEYNLDIAKARAQKFFEGIVYKVLHHAQGGYILEDMVLGLGGDLMTGFIHQELRETNYLSPLEASDWLIDVICAGIDVILKETGIKRLHIPCVPGNHGRNTEKRTIKTVVRNSYEWLVYRQIARHFRNDSRVTFAIAEGAHVYVDVGPWVIRVTHGDSIKYGGGILGVNVPVKKKVMEWNKAKHADYTVMGHFHQLQDHGDVLINGSLIGYGEYSLEIGAGFEHPKQLFFLVDHERGKDYVSTIWVSEAGSRKG